MHFSDSFKFPQDVDTIFKSTTSKRFLMKKMKALGARNITIDIEKKGNKVTIEIQREMQAEVPGPLKKFIKPWNKITQSEVWTGEKGGPYTAKMKMDIHGVPVTIKGQLKLKKKKSGSSIENETTVKSGIPFFGRTLSKFVIEASEKAIQEEFDYIREHV